MAWDGLDRLPEDRPNFARITVLAGPDAARQAYRTLVASDAGPNEALVLMFGNRRAGRSNAVTRGGAVGAR